MSLPALTAKANTATALAALQTAADAKFIADVDAQIATAINLGSYVITAVTNANVNITTIYNYYTGLGYHLEFPDYQQQNGQALPSIIQQPQNFFGYNWVQYWLNAIGAFHIKNPARITVSWFRI